MATDSSFTALPDDVLQRVLLGVALDDHDATAAACRAFRAVIRGPRFLRLRREYGFAERGIILVGSRPDWPHRGPMEIHLAGNRVPVEIMPKKRTNLRGSTTDGGARLFFTIRQTSKTTLLFKKTLFLGKFKNQFDLACLFRPISMNDSFDFII